ncbi:nose resistant to fluoxetine protein 6-like [Rhopilema esculentum]|uniref:nose resistant to fluoxetine protein 6-like n=1 Tax=Rhopilema esculentum TaxID=499914 RepID=UPI0031DFEB39
MISIFRRQPAASFEDLVYIKPYCRIIPYLAGMLLGYLLFRKVQIKGQLKPLFAVIGWAVAIGGGMAVVYGTWDTTKKGGKPFTEAENILYGSLSRLTWSVALSWVIFACHTGVGGLVNSILSWRAFIPLSRLTFGAYLLHPLVMIIFYQTKQSPRAYTDMDMAFQFVAITAFSYASAFILALGVEYPTLNLEKKIFGQ